MIAGGHAAFNPEPISDFVDAAVLGDGEEIVLAISEVVREWKAEGRPGSRDALLRRLSVSQNVYVPKFYCVAYAADGTIEAVVPNKPGHPVPGPQAHVDGPRRLALPGQAARDVVGGISFCMVFLYAGHMSVARRFAAHLPEWVPSDRAGSIAAMVLIMGMLVFVVRIIAGLLKAPADVDPAHPAG